MKKKILSALTALALAVSMCGCADVDGKTSAAVKQTSELLSSLSDVSVETSVTDGKLTVNVGENSTLPEKAKIYHQKRMTFTKEQFLKLFNEPPTQDAEVTFRYTNENEGGNYGEDDKDSVSHWTNAGIFYYTTAESFLSWERTDRISTTEELDFCSREQAYKKVVEFLQSNFGIAPEDIAQNDFYSVTKESFELYKKELIEEVNAPLESGEYEEDREKEKERAERASKIQGVDYYYFKVNFKIDDIPLTSGMSVQYSSAEGTYIAAPRCNIILTENGMEHFILSYMYENDSSKPPEEAELIGKNKAESIAVKKYEDIIFEGEIEIGDVSLVYLPISQQGVEAGSTVYETRPYYLVSSNKTEDINGEIRETRSELYIDAVTGEEFTEVNMRGGMVMLQ